MTVHCICEVCGKESEPEFWAIEDAGLTMSGEVATQILIDRLTKEGWSMVPEHERCPECAKT